MSWYGSFANAINPFNDGADQGKDAAQAGATRQGGYASGFANTGESNYNAMTGRGNDYLDRLDALASGRDSVSAEQLRQGLQQQQGQQIGYAAGAAPGNAAMAARSAANNIGRAGSAMAGNAAMAGIAERNAATQALGQGILGMRGQDANVALESRGNAINSYGTILGQPREPGFWDYATQIGSAGLGAAAMSDERLKEDIEPADDEARKTLDGLQAYVYKYKGKKYGKGKQFGIMAQDLERSGLGHAVIETPDGKAVHGAKLATSVAGLAAALAKRVTKLERKGK